MSDRTALVFVVAVGALVGVLIIELIERSGLLR
jgi:hypothetical protein